MVASVLSSLRARLVLLVLFALVPAFGLIVWSNLEQRREQREASQALAQQITGSVAAQEAQVLQSARELLSQLVVAPAVASADVAACQDYLAGVMAIEPRYVGFGVANLQGDIVCSGTDVHPNVADRSYFQRVIATREFAVGDYVLSRDGTSTPVLSFAHPMFDAQRQLVGMLATGVKLDWLGEFSSRLTLPGGAVLTVLDSNGVVLARHPDGGGYVGEALPEQPLVKRVLTDGVGTAETSGLDGVDRLYAFAPLDKESGAFVAVGIPPSTAYAGINGTLYRNLALLGLVTTLALAAAWFFGERLVARDLRTLGRAAQRLQRGDLSARSGLRYDGEIGQLAATFDETAQELERRNRELRESEERFRSFVENAADGVLMVDRRGKIVSINPAGELLFGHTRDEIAGQPVELLLPEALRERHVQHREDFHASPSVRPMGAELDLKARRKDGSEFPVAISLTPLSAGEGGLVAANVRDVTQQKRAEETLQCTLEDLQRSNTELEQFAYVASHDLQEPLRMVGNYTQLLARRYKGKLDADADDFIGYAVEGAQRMQTLINDLLAFSRVGTRGKEPADTDAEAVLERTLRDLKASAAEAGVEITHDPLPTVIADDGQLGQLFQNLIANAIKFRGEAPPRVHVSAERNGSGYVFSLKDNGIGIDPEYFDRIFVIFQRLHGREEYQGTGMGLAICKKIVERHGGRIWVESEAGRGTTFLFTMPAPREARAAA